MIFEPKLTIGDVGHQGDVVIKKVASIPAGKRVDAKEEGVAVLAHGEVTGHKHQIIEGEVNYSKIETGENQFVNYLEVLSDKAILSHEEHHPIALEKGFYEISIQREYSPEEIRNVAD